MINGLKCIFPIFCSCFVHILLGQEMQSSHFFHSLKQTDGLSGAWNAYVHRDSRGFVWISTVDGLNRFDGLNVKVYKSNDEKNNQLKGNNIQSDFFEDSDHNLWFSTYDYINCYRRKTDDFQSFQVRDAQRQTIKSGYRAFHLDKNHQLWLQVDSDLFIFDIISKSFQQKTLTMPHRYAQMIQQNEHSNTLVTYNKTLGFDIVQIKSNNQVVQKTYFNNGKWALNVTDILVINDSIFKVATDVGLLHFNKNQPYHTVKIDSTFQKLSVKGIVSLSKIPHSNEVLVTTANNGIFAYDLRQEAFTYRLTATNDAADNLIFKKIWRAYLDSSAHLWVSTVGEGIWHTAIHKSKFKFIPIATDRQALSVNNSNFIEYQKDKIIAISQDGLAFFKNQKFEKNLQLFENQKVVRINQIIKDKSGIIWAVAITGLYQVDVDEGKFQNKGIHGMVDYLFQLSNGHFLCSGHNNVYEITASGVQVNRNFQESLDTTKAYGNIYEDQNGTVFIAQNYETLLIFKKNQSDYSLVKGLPITGTINGFYEDNDGKNLWIGTTNGLVKLDKTDFNYKILTEQHGLPNQYICGIVGDKDNKIWLSTNKGLVRFDQYQNIFRQFTLTDGLLSEEGIDMAFAKMSDGSVWLGNAKGINIFQPETINDFTIKPHIQIISFRINDVSVVRHFNIMEQTEINLNEGERTLSFNFIAIEHSDAKKNLLEYRLKNYDDKWLTVKNTEGSVRYANLPSGTYYLQIKGANSDGIWNEEMRELKITVPTPWYLTWWFITLCTIATMSLIGYILYLRISKFIDLQEIRIKLYENLHDDLGSRLMAIVMMIDPMALKTKMGVLEGQNTEGSQTLLDIRAIASNIVGNMRRLVWATDPKNDELSNVMQQMNTDKELLMPKVALIIHAEETIKQLKIDGNKRYQMLAVFNEALTNTHKYAEATCVTVKLKKDDNIFTVFIEDNGKGFDTTKSRTDSLMSGGQGTRNMYNRAKRINGQITIASKLGVGTTITLAFPLTSLSFLARVKQFMAWTAPK
jgi:ligand-binding sensor domain-containing protein/anti-sigma regulatory factor (Ser/Thr protein kinase)